MNLVVMLQHRYKIILGITGLVISIGILAFQLYVHDRQIVKDSNAHFNQMRKLRAEFMKAKYEEAKYVSLLHRLEYIKNGYIKTSDKEKEVNGIKAEMTQLKKNIDVAELHEIRDEISDLVAKDQQLGQVYAFGRKRYLSYFPLIEVKSFIRNFNRHTKQQHN